MGTQEKVVVHDSELEKIHRWVNPLRSWRHGLAALFQLAHAFVWGWNEMKKKKKATSSGLAPLLNLPVNYAGSWVQTMNVIWELDTGLAIYRRTYFFPYWPFKVMQPKKILWLQKAFFHRPQYKNKGFKNCWTGWMWSETQFIIDLSIVDFLFNVY